MVVDNVRNVFLGMRLVGPAMAKYPAATDRSRGAVPIARLRHPWRLFQLSAKSGFVYLKYSTDSLVAGDGGNARYPAAIFPKPAMRRDCRGVACRMIALKMADTRVITC